MVDTKIAYSNVLENMGRRGRAPRGATDGDSCFLNGGLRADKIVSIKIVKNDVSCAVPRVRS